MALRRASDRATSERSGFKDFVSPRTVCTCTGHVPNKNCQKKHSISPKRARGPIKGRFWVLTTRHTNHFFNSKNDDQIYMEKLYIPVSIQKSNLNIQTWTRTGSKNERSHFLIGQHRIDNSPRAVRKFRTIDFSTYKKRRSSLDALFWVLNLQLFFFTLGLTFIDDTHKWDVFHFWPINDRRMALLHWYRTYLIMYI